MFLQVYLEGNKPSLKRKRKRKEKTNHFESYLEYAGASQSNIQKERSTKNVPVHKASNTQQDEEPCADLGGINTEGKVPAIL